MCLTSWLVLLQEHKFWEESFRVYEKGVAVFKYPHVRDIWLAYLQQFVKRYGGDQAGARPRPFQAGPPRGASRSRPAEQGLAGTRARPNSQGSACVPEVCPLLNAEDLHPGTLKKL